MNNHHYNYILQLADNALILGQRYTEWCGIAPELEIDLAISNTALDHLGQADMWLQYAVDIGGEYRTSDELAFLRDTPEFRNAQLLELPIGDFAHTIIRALLFDWYNLKLHESLINSSDEKIAAIASKAVKEIRYHVRYSTQWTLRMGDGTDESHRRMQDALNEIWEYAGELFHPSEADEWARDNKIGPDLSEIKNQWMDEIKGIVQKATLTLPSSEYHHQGGKQGIHTEYLGFILAEMQFMQRAYPGLNW